MAKNEKWEQFKWDCEQKWMSAKDWMRQNKDVVVVCAPIVLGGTFKILKECSRNRRVDEERDLKEKWVYDRSNGHYYELRRKIKSQEWLIIDQRKAEGESLGQILASMRLLK